MDTEKCESDIFICSRQTTCTEIKIYLMSLLSILIFVVYTMDSEGKNFGADNPIERLMRWGNAQKKLRDLVRAKQAEGVISSADAQAIETLRESFHHQQGIRRDLSDRRALHSADEPLAEAGVMRQCYYLMKGKLLELYPDLAEEIRALDTPQPRR